MPSILAVQWVGDLSGCVRLIDQTLLPTTLEYRDCRTMEEIWEAIRTLRVRGAPAIGVTAAMGVVLGMRSCPNIAEWNHRLGEVCRLPAQQSADRGQPFLGPGPHGTDR